MTMRSAAMTTATAIMACPRGCQASTALLAVHPSPAYQGHHAPGRIPGSSAARMIPARRSTAPARSHARARSWRVPEDAAGQRVHPRLDGLGGAGCCVGVGEQGDGGNPLLGGVEAENFRHGVGKLLPGHDAPPPHARRPPCPPPLPPHPPTPPPSPTPSPTPPP